VTKPRLIQDPSAREPFDETAHEQKRLKEFNIGWWGAGRPVYELSQTVAAALTATRAPRMPWSHCPYPAFMIDVPIEYLPVAHIRGLNGPRIWIAIATTPNFRYVGLMFIKRDEQGRRVFGEVDYVEARGLFITDDDNVFHENMTREFLYDRYDSKLPLELKLALRLATNVIAYVTTYRECVSLKSKASDSQGTRVLDVNAPKSVVIDREFREHIKQLVAARTVPRARGVLAHLVRGHWKNQLSGSERTQRKLIWIAPYRRGDSNIGAVVSRTERLL
jgi:uncharacterized protein YbgA (DUF1722 family)